MGSRHEETTDGTSIVNPRLPELQLPADVYIQKPVSSLRSHFERFAHHDHPSRTPRRSLTPDSLTQFKSLDCGTSRNERFSLDTLRTEPTANQSSMPRSRGAHQHIDSPTKSAPHWLAADSPRQSEPGSNHPLLSPHSSPPAVTIHSPISPQQTLNVSESIPGTSGQQGLITRATGPPRQSRSSVTMVAPVPNRASKPTLHSRPTHRPACPTKVWESGMRSRSR